MVTANPHDEMEAHYEANYGAALLCRCTEWQSIETTPEDTIVLVATHGGHVDTAFWTDEDGEGRKWWWLVSASEYAKHPIHPNLVPTHWMHLPQHPNPPAIPGLVEKQVSSD